MDGSPQVVRFDVTTLWHFDAAEWAPSTASKAADQSRQQFRPMSALPPRADIVQVIPVANSCERGHGSLTRLSVPARGSSAAILTTRYTQSHTPALDTDSFAKIPLAPT